VLFWLSTTDVDNFVDKRLLTARKPSIDAGFNKLLKTKAKINHLKINGLVFKRFCKNETRKNFYAISGGSGFCE
jgi:hypothetical protein